MFGVGIIELLILIVIVVVVAPLILYWVIRKATSAGARDAEREQPGGMPQ